ncbi:DNA helicase RecQ [Roseimaritima ulvae]|uniref:DNA helicase RecQ n=1 Tax=Roseimaritima ulvae TaxID=980254 RepID=A0A5B9QRX4_9BACT|nr:DNA helicase RecQ [Roseimaritima ulvae]QEG40659.1 ATP-dependent DNA helicase RecQ [Roseimaritima ulvae]
MSYASETDLATAHQVLREVWGYEQFRDLQEEAVSDVIAGLDSVVVLPTGAGKSLCYQVPALVREGMAVVVSPLISLMKDQVDALTSNGVGAALVNSTQTMSEKREVAERIRGGQVRLLYMAPERLLTERTLEFLQHQAISFFAIDEAHCVSAWGHDFRPEYRGLSVLKERFPNASVHAFTATASAKIRDDIAQQLRLTAPRLLVGGFDRPNLTYRMLRSDGRIDQVLDVIQRHPDESGIVYAITRREVEQIAQTLTASGISALPYHAGLDDAQRQRNQEAFIQEKVDVIVATVAFGMGIDKANVRYVVHAGMPKSIEHYQQESGRAGRDGLASECVLIYSGGDLMTWKRILENGSSDQFQTAMASVNAMAELCTAIRCRHAALVEYFGQEYGADNCGACDVCLGELDMVEDPLILAQKILSCVARLQERFGAGHTAKVLLGSRAKRIAEFNHDQLSTFGLLADQPAQAVRTWIDQLVSQSFLEKVGEFQTLRITDRGREVLRGRGEVQLTTVQARSRRRRGEETTSWEGVDRGLFDHLRRCRSQWAGERNVPAYIIAGDAVLRELARRRPSTLQQMADIEGIGTRKLEDVGPLLLSEIDDYCQEQPMDRDVPATATTRVRRTTTAVNPSLQTAFEAFRKGESVANVAASMGRAESTVTGYLQKFLQDEQITDPTTWVEASLVSRIEAALETAEDNKLKPIFEKLNGEVSYDAIRIVATCRTNRPVA